MFTKQIQLYVLCITLLCIISPVFTLNITEIEEINKLSNYTNTSNQTWLNLFNISKQINLTNLSHINHTHNLTNYTTMDLFINTTNNLSYQISVVESKINQELYNLFNVSIEDTVRNKSLEIVGILTELEEQNTERLKSKVDNTEFNRTTAILSNELYNREIAIRESITDAVNFMLMINIIIIIVACVILFFLLKRQGITPLMPAQIRGLPEKQVSTSDFSYDSEFRDKLARIRDLKQKALKSNLKPDEKVYILNSIDKSEINNLEELDLALKLVKEEFAIRKAAGELSEKIKKR